MKAKISQSNLFSKLSVIFAVTLFLFTFGRVVAQGYWDTGAQTPGNIEITNPLSDAVVEEVSGSNKTFWEKIQALISLDIRRTITNQINSAIESAILNIVVGANHETISKCLPTWNSLSGNILLQSTQNNADDNTIEACTNIVQNNCDPNDPSCQTIAYLNPGSGGRNLAKGSLIHIAYALEGATEDPLPFNLAYYFNRQVEKIPFAGPALAQSRTDFGGPFLEVTYDLWSITRDAAFALIAIVMIVIGMMIMTRKRINPQTMVTVQYALPRILIAFVLIAFSYVIGATIASTAWVLRRSANDIVMSLISPHMTLLLQLGVIVVIMVEAVLFAAIIFSSGGAAIILLVAMIAAAAVFAMLVEIRIFMVYLKMIVMIITAPIQFAMGAIPGQEKSTINWFKGMGAKALSIFLMRVITSMARTAVIFLVISNVNQISQAWGNAGQVISQGAQYIGFVLLLPLITPFILVYGYYQAFKLPKKIDEMILGKRR